MGVLEFAGASILLMSLCVYVGESLRAGSKSDKILWWAVPAYILAIAGIWAMIGGAIYCVFKFFAFLLP
jgi:hypothetical protein